MPREVFLLVTGGRPALTVEATRRQNSAAQAEKEKCLVMVDECLLGRGSRSKLPVKKSVVAACNGLERRSFSTEFSTGSLLTFQI